MREGKYQGRVKLFRGKGRQCKLYIKVKEMTLVIITFDNIIALQLVVRNYVGSYIDFEHNQGRRNR